MRQIEFRGKRVDNGEWVYGFYLFGSNKYHQILSGKWHRVSGSPYSYEVIPSTVGQFIGLTDKNRTKIFEGDIDQYGGIVVYDTLARFCIDYGHKVSLTYTESTFEITGNIHDNPTP